jgi:hypothetical protein
MNAHPDTNARDNGRLARALDNLTRRIEAGEEFPDACFAAASRGNVPYEALTAAYDAACSLSTVGPLTAEQRAEADALTTAHTCFESLQDMQDASGHYRPSLHTFERNTAGDAPALRRLADLYDQAQAARGDDRRAYRY